MPTKLGQNFLTDPIIAENIVKYANLSRTDNVLEIGPGKGVLTKYLAEYAGKVLAIEIDRSLIVSLKKVLENKKNAEIIAGDILKENLPKLMKENDFQNYKVVANLPYYITSKIIRLFLETKYPPSEMILMVQKEVGERICAPRGKGSILSISVKFYAEPKILFSVPRENFDPIPEVDSVVMRIKRKNNISNVDIDRFFSLVRAGFCARRKMISNNLSTSFHIPKARLWEWLKSAGIEPTQRAQELSLANWIKLYDKWEN
jgi:16S rRNA (adenine1518-N6/adenine1519-N6)-dimethyltransferase